MTLNRSKVLNEIALFSNVNFDNWNKRHYFSSSKSGNILPRHALECKSLIRDQGLKVNVRTHLNLVTGTTFDIKKKRYYDALFDWDNIGRLNERNNFLAKQARLGGMPEVAEFLETQSTIIDPEDLPGYDKLTQDQKVYLRLIVIYSGNPSKKELIRDISMLHSLDESVANQLIDKNIFLYEDLPYYWFPFRPNRNHVVSFKNIFESFCNADIFVVGSFGRGVMEGNDIDLLFRQSDREEVEKTLKIMSIKNTSNSYILNILDTLIRIDVGFFTGEDFFVKMIYGLGPRDRITTLKSIARKQGFTFSENGLYQSGNIYLPQNFDELVELLGIEKYDLPLYNGYHSTK